MREDVLAVRVDAVESQFRGLQAQFETLEERMTAQFDRMFGVLDQVREELVKERVETAKRMTCPQPGLCLQLQGELKRLDEDLKLLSQQKCAEHEKMWADIVTLKTANTRFAAALAVVLSILTFAAPILRDWIVKLIHHASGTGTP